MANSSSVGSPTRHFDPSNYQASIEAKLKPAKLSSNDKDKLRALLEKYPAQRQGATAFWDNLYKRPKLWAAFIYSFRKCLPARTPVLVGCLDNHCRVCNELTINKIPVCRECCKTEVGRQMRWALRTEKSNATMKISGGMQRGLAKRKLTNLARYGGVSPMSSPEVRAKVSAAWGDVDKAAVTAKRRATNLARYGVQSPTQRPEFAEQVRAAWSKKSPNELRGIDKSRKKTHKERYGTESPRQRREVIEKAAATYKERTGYDHNMRNPDAVEGYRREHKAKYGVEHSMQRPEVRAKVSAVMLSNWGGSGLGSPTLRKQIRQTNLERYGHEVPTSNPAIMAKCKATWLQKYGFENPNQNPEQALKGLRSSFHRKDVIIDGRTYTVQGKSEVILLRRLLNKFGEVHTQFDSAYPRDVAGDLGWTPDFYVPGHGFFECKSTWTLTMPAALARNREKAKASPAVTWVVVMPGGKCVRLPADWHTHSNPEALIWSRYYTSIGVDAYSEKYVRQIAAWLGSDTVRKQTVYLPSRKIAVTFVPHYWSNADEMLAQKQRADATGYRLVFLHEDVVRLHAQAARKFCERLAGDTGRRVYARECEVRCAPAKKVAKFLEANHIQGSVRSGTAYCLVHNRKLVAAMLFGHTVSSRGSTRQEGVYELTRYATRGSVVGGASKLLAAFSKAAAPKEIVSYSDSAVFTGDMYEVLGFQRVRQTATEYYAWFGGPRKLPKQHFSKKNLSAMFGLDVAGCTERQLCEELSLQPVYSLGKTKWVRNFM